MIEAIIHLHKNAPEKPEEGAPCNGCGVCCAVETCPAARLRFLKKDGPCPALRWSDTAACYRCGLLVQPQDFLGWLPEAFVPSASRLFARWIAAGRGCDCSIRVKNPDKKTV